MSLLSIDIGLVNTGYALFKDGSFVSGGTLVIKEKENRTRFKLIFKFFSSYIELHEIKTIVYEQSINGMNKVVFHNLNIVCGLMEALAIQNDIDCFCYLPNIVKKTVTENGRADKKEVQKGVEKILNNDQIEILPVSFCRGRSFNNKGVLIEESQNLTPQNILTLLTRIGKNSKLVFNGDDNQADLARRSGMHYLDLLVRGVPGADVIEFTNKQIERHPIIAHILRKAESLSLFNY